MRSVLVYSVSATIAIWLTGSLPASAQETAAAGDRARASDALEEVVVTAQRRGENLQRVPIAVTALDAQSLSSLGGRTSEDLALLAPSVTFNNNVSSGAITIRGVGATGSGGDEPGNAVYIDGVYQMSPSALLFSLNSVERLEVLKGPQGTLFGRNASGGVVQIITRDPSSEPSVDTSLGYGSYEVSEAKLYVNAPLSDSVAANASFYGTHQNEGWGRDLRTGEEAHEGYAWGGRGKLKWDSGERTDVVLAALYAETQPQSAQGAQIAPGLRNVLGIGNQGFYNIDQNLVPDRVTKQSTVSASVHHEFTGARLLSISAYDRVRSVLIYDQDTTRAPLVNADLRGDVSTFTQELQIQSPDQSSFTWLAGLYYLNSESDGKLFVSGVAPPIAASGGSQTTPSTQRTDSYSAFGQVTVPLRDTTRMTSGLRYTIDERELDSTPFNANNPTPQVFPTKTTRDTKLTWRFALDQELSEQVLAYASYSRGFKSGLFNSVNPTSPVVQPQTVDAYELGIKSEALDRRLRLNASAFYYDFQDIQFRSVVLGTTIFANAGRARIKGLDLDAAFVPFERVTLTAAVSLLDGRYIADEGNLPVPFFTVPPAPAGGLVQSTASPVGNDTINTPPVALTLGAQYLLPTERGEYQFAIAVNHNGGYFFEPSNFIEQPAYELVNASVEWRSASGRFDVQLWGRNLLDEKIFAGVDVSALGATYFPAAPRTVGVTFGVHF